MGGLESGRKEVATWLAKAWPKTPPKPCSGWVRRPMKTILKRSNGSEVVMPWARVSSETSPKL